MKKMYFNKVPFVLVYQSVTLREKWDITALSLFFLFMLVYQCLYLYNEFVVKIVVKKRTALIRQSACKICIMLTSFYPQFVQMSGVSFEHLFRYKYSLL